MLVRAAADKGDDLFCIDDSDALREGMREGAGVLAGVLEGEEVVEDDEEKENLVGEEHAEELALAAME